MYIGHHSYNVKPIKTEPFYIDHGIYQGSMRHQDGYTSPHTNTQRPYPNPPPVNRYPERPPFTAHTQARPSVIRNVNNARDQDQKFLQMESQMLKMHGELLKQTGNLM